MAGSHVEVWASSIGAWARPANSKATSQLGQPHSPTYDPIQDNVPVLELDIVEHPV